MTFRQYSAAASIAAILLVYGFYAIKLVNAPLVPMEAVKALIGSTIVIIIVQIALHSLIALRGPIKPEQADERDRLVELRSVRNAYPVLCAVAWGAAMLGIATRSPIILTYALVGGFAAAEVVRYASQLIYYRFGP